jgi:Zn-dependent protease/predicted transcriptional regulator
MLGRPIPLFKVFGFEVRIDASWIFLAILIIWSLAFGVFPAEYPDLNPFAYWWMGIFGAFGLFTCILLHELSHSLVAKAYGLPMRGITLFIFGGVAEMEEDPKSPKVEFQMAAIGPVVSAVLGFLFGLLASAGEKFLWSDPIIGVFSYLGTINFILAGFNMIPAFPLDGGRVLRAGLWKWKNDIYKATRIASRAGEFFGMLLIVMGVIGFFRGNFLGGMWWVLIGMFLKDAARLGYEQMLLQKTLQGETVQHFMTSLPITVSPKLSLAEFIERFLYRYHHKMFPVTDDTKLVGCIYMQDLKKMPSSEWKFHTVKELTVPCSKENTVHPDTEAKEALAIMGTTGNTRLLVVENHQLVGVVVLKDMMKLLSIRMEIEGYTREAA